MSGLMTVSPTDFAGVDMLVADEERTVGSDAAANAANRSRVVIGLKNGHFAAFKEIDSVDLGTDRGKTAAAPRLVDFT